MLDADLVFWRRYNDSVAAAVLGLVESLIGPLQDLGAGGAAIGVGGDTAADGEPAPRLLCTVEEVVGLDPRPDLLTYDVGFGRRSIWQDE